MTTITIDAAELHAAAPSVAEMYAELVGVGHSINRVEVGALPAPLAARIQLELAELHHELIKAADAIQGTAHELLERAGLAEAADKLSTLALALSGPELTANLINDAHEIGKAKYGIPDKVGNIASKAGYGLALAGIILQVAVPSAHDLANPYLDDTRKSANALARSATTAGILVAGGVAAGLASPGLAAAAAAIGVGVALSVIDQKLEITEHLADGINAGLDATDRVLDEVGGVANDAIDGVGDVADDAVDKAGDLAGGAADKVGDVLG
ncbi:MAG: hypothetical protein ACRDTC_22570, partial [Pseudonocardiaceae bacterium]